MGRNIEAERRWQREQIEAAIRQIAKLRDDWRAASSLNARQASFWGNLHLILGIPAAVLAALAGASALTEIAGRVTAGVIALAAAVLSTLLAWLGGEERHRRHSALAGGLARLADDADRYVNIEAINPRVKLDAPYLLDDFDERYTVVASGQPLPPRWFRGMPTRADDDDDFSWLVDEEDE
jgi:hypothetical protein